MSNKKKLKAIVVKIKKHLKELEDEINSTESVQDTNDDDEDDGGGNNPEPPDIP